MPRSCTVCTHPARDAIDHALVGETAYRRIAAQFSVSEQAIRRHRSEHLPAMLAQAARVEQEATAVDVMVELRAVMRRVTLLFDACDRWLRDPSDPTRYELGPRSEDVTVIYSESAGCGAPIRKRARLSELLAQAGIEGRVIDRSEWRHADPRELVLKTADRVKALLELMAELSQELDRRPQINVTLSAEWVQVRTVLLEALQPYPEARSAVAGRLRSLELVS